MGLSLSARRCDFCHDLLDGFSVGIGHDDAAAFARETSRGSGSDFAACAGDENDFVSETHRPE
jgi:hypothetical protein